MATERLVTRNIREILRLRWSEGLSTRKTAQSVGRSVGVVAKTTERAQTAGLDWAAVCALDDAALERRLYGERAKARTGEPRPEPDPAWMHIELKRVGVTLELLHLEYLQAHPDGLQYTAFCDRYRAWKKRARISMRQSHKAGEHMFVDFSGKRPCITDPETGEVTPVELFVAVLGASSLTYAEATRTQQLPDWISVHTRAVEYFGGSASVWVPDQLKSAVTKPGRHHPRIQRTYFDQARHYGAVVIPARPGRAKDKAKVEVGVQVAQRWILARLRHETFFSLDALNQRIFELLEELNDRPRRQLGGISRSALFERVERTALLPLPEAPFAHHDWKHAKVNVDYHVQVDFHWYSVPHTLVGEEVDVCFSATTVEVLHLNRVVARHARSRVKYAHTTDAAHRPPNHQAWADRDPGGLLHWAAEMGPNTEALMQAILESNPFRDQTWRSGRALRRIGDKYGAARMEVACGRAIQFGARSYKPVDRMLKHNLDLSPHPDDAPDESKPIHHNQVRGPGYYMH